MSIIVDIQKLIGNCGYGGFIMDQFKYCYVIYVQGINVVSDEVNDLFFILFFDIK